jgi:toxin CcdB
MAPFDVHRNKGALRESIPLVVLVQSAQFDRYRRRVVVPLVLHPLDLVSVATDQLGERAGSLAEHGKAITETLDELLTRSWG